MTAHSQSVPPRPVSTSADHGDFGATPAIPADEARAKVTDLIKGMRVAMLTTTDADGSLVSHPMATQDVEFDGDVWFIAERSSHKVANILTSPKVNVAYSSADSWVSLSGRARIVSDTAKLQEFWSMFTDAWMDGGPENPNNILIHVQAESAEYWDTPGSRVVQVVNLVKAAVTGQRYEGDNERVDLA